MSTNSIDRKYYNDISSHEILGKKEAYKLIIKAQRGDEASRNKMIEHNLRLVVSVAMKFNGRGLSIDQLISAGNMGLFSAVNRFNTGMDLEFSTYATIWIKQAILRALDLEKHSVHVPCYLQEFHRKVAAVKRTERANTGFEPSTLQSLLLLGLNEGKARKLLLRMNSAKSALGSPAKIDGERSEFGIHLNGSGTRDTIPRIAITNEMKEILMDKINILSDREKNIITQRYGLDGKGERTLKVIALSMSPPVTRERVRQIINRCIAKLGSEMKDITDNGG